MPYVAKGKCVYKRDTGKKVGCTKGSVKKYLSALHANVNESETDPLDWAKDIIKGVDYSVQIVKDGEILYPLDKLPNDSILKISGEQDYLVFENQECRVIRRTTYKGGSEYLMVFPEVIESDFDHTHCGQSPDHFNQCHCSDIGSDTGRCWFVQMENMMDITYYPDRLKLVNESENYDPFEWAKKTIESIDTNLRGKAWFIELPGPMEDFEDAQRWAFSQGFSWSYTKKDLLDMSQQSKYANICKLGSIFEGDIKRGSMTFSGSYGKCDDKEINKSIDIAKENSKEEILIHLKWDSNKKEPVFVDVISLNKKGIREQEEDFNWVEDIDFSKYLKVGQVFEEKLFKRRYFFEITKIDEDSIKVDGFPLEDPEHRKAYNISYDAFLRLSNRGWWVPINPPINESREILTEGRWDSLTRQVVRDIMFSITNNEKVKKFDISLPNDLRENEWEYEKDGVTFSIDLKVYRKPLLSGEKGNEYVVNTAIMDDEDENIIGVNIIVDSKLGSKTYEKIFFKLQEDIRHEIEHLTQVGTPATSKIKTVYGHHKNKFEVPALVHGFYRRAKLEKRPIDEIMIEDLDSEIERGNLTKKEAQKLLTIWIDYSKKNLPAAIYSNE